MGNLKVRMGLSLKIRIKKKLPLEIGCRRSAVWLAGGREDYAGVRTGWEFAEMGEAREGGVDDFVEAGRVQRERANRGRLLAADVGFDAEGAVGPAADAIKRKIMRASE
jgi:hypothetical protein